MIRSFLCPARRVVLALILIMMLSVLVHSSVRADDSPQSASDGTVVSLDSDVRLSGDGEESQEQQGPGGEVEDESPAFAGSWELSSEGWRYRNADGTFVTAQILAIGGVRYAFNADGFVVRGWYQDGSGLWYLSGDNGLGTGWQHTGGRWYYLGIDGVMTTGWLTDNGLRYWLLDSGAMAVGWVHIGGHWYHFGGSGAMTVSSWHLDQGLWYYLRADGTMAIGWILLADNWYYLYPSGAMATGWVQIGSRWYCLDGSGAMTNGWVVSGGRWYYLDPTQGGAMVTGRVNIGGREHWFDEWSGFWVTDRATFAADLAWARLQYSPTNYLLMVDTRTPRCMAFYWRNGTWQPLWDWECSVGAPWTPTVTGHYHIGLRGSSFGVGYTAYWWTQFHGDYLFHSVLYRQGTYSLLDGTLNGHVSHGCVRMNIWDAKWIHDNIPTGTKVVSY